MSWPDASGNKLNVDETRGMFAKLKRRNLLRAGVLYAGAVWAQQALQKLLHESGDQASTEGNLAMAHVGLGQNDAAFKAARRATDLLSISQDALDGTLHFARRAKIEALVGDTDSALKPIEQLLAAPAGYEVFAASLRFDPVWDLLRKNPRFQQLMTDADVLQAKLIQ